MTITKRSIKGSALTYAEMDENLRDLDSDMTIDRVLKNHDSSGRNITLTGLSTIKSISSDSATVDTLVAPALRSSLLTLDSDSRIGRAPKVIEVKDTVSGCPPTRAAGSEIMRMDWSMERSGFVTICYSTIANHTARCDHSLYLDGVSEAMTLTSTNSNSWKPVTVTWGGVLGAGDHNCYLYNHTANVTGCGTTWGRGWVTIYE